MIDPEMPVALESDRDARPVSSFCNNDCLWQVELRNKPEVDADVVRVNVVVETERVRRPDRVFADGGPSPWVSVLHDGGG